MEQTQITQKRIMEELGAIAFARATDMLTVEGGTLTVADTASLGDGLGRAIAAVEKGTGGVKVKFYDKLKALELLGKALGLFEGTAEQQEDNGLLEAILDATKGAGGAPQAAERPPR